MVQANDLESSLLALLQRGGEAYESRRCGQERERRARVGWISSPKNGLSWLTRQPETRDELQKLPVYPQLDIIFSC